jgi:FkbM family methyltransferase
LYIPDYHFALKTAKQRIDPRRLSYDRSTGLIKVTDLGITISEEKNEFMLDVLRYADDLIMGAEAQFSQTSDGTIMVDVKGVRAELRTAGEVGVLWEVYAQNMYNIDLPENAVVWDIGMNTGLASLFFAKCKKVKVYGYEPFPYTYCRAMANIGHNPDISSSIRTFKKGVASSSGGLKIDFDPVNHETNGIFGPTKRSTAPLEKVNVEMVGAVETFDMIAAENPGAPIILKIDCEGAEFEIISSLQKSGRLQGLKAILLEWHMAGDPEGPKKLEDDLRTAGFTFVTLNKTDWSTGLIYAFQ